MERQVPRLVQRAKEVGALLALGSGARTQVEFCAELPLKPISECDFSVKAERSSDVELFQGVRRDVVTTHWHR